MSAWEILRQGDVLLMCVGELPESSARIRRNGRIVLAEGEATGHAHVVASRRAAVHSTRDGDRYLVVGGDRPALLRHEEHDSISVPPGIWEIRRQREYDPRTDARWIAD